MKVGNKLLNRIVAVAMLAVVVLSSVSVSFADLKTDYDGIMSSNAISTLKDDWTSPNNKNFHREYSVQGSSNVYLMCIGGVYWLVSKENFSVNQVTKLDDGSVYSESSLTVSPNKCNHYNFYSVQLSFHCDRVYAPCAVFDYDTWVDLNKKDSSKYDAYPVHVMGAFLFDVYFMEYVKIENSKAEGSQDNPDIDEAIGYLVIKNTNVNQQSDLGTLKDGVLPLYFNFDWKDKTSTGFSLTKNKYARTFIQVEVESKFVVYSDVKHTKIKHKFDNYGERGWLSKNIDPSNKPITFDSGDINNALPLTYSEILTQVDKNKIYGSLGQAIFPIGYNFLIRYRIVCTDSLTVIPDTSSGWHAGPWASTTLSGDDINDTSSDKSDHEGYGDDKNKNGETDDINHTRTDYDDNQDAKDNINDKKNDKSSLDLDSAKEFINQVAAVPKMIGDLFSFFPNWVKYTVELGFAFIFILIVYKLIRG